MAEARPTVRDEFQIAIICALEVEAEAVLYLFDQLWDEDGDSFGKAHRDPNCYRTGRIGKHNVVLFILPGMGKANAASAASALLSSYTGVRLALIVGICGGVPVPVAGSRQEEILLGDVVISDAVVQFDFGRRLPSGQFHVKDGASERLRKVDGYVNGLLRNLGTQQGKDWLEKGAMKFLSRLQKNRIMAMGDKCYGDSRYAYPGTIWDQLYPASYVHRHHRDPTCGCDDLQACGAALKQSCEDIGCEESKLIKTRPRLEGRRRREDIGDKRVQAPTVHIGAIASGDTVMKSGEDRDRIAVQQNIIAFEMEGAGVWELPHMSCLVIKGVCDYADSHKNKRWQGFAAATAAAVMASLMRLIAHHEVSASTQLHVLKQRRDSMIEKVSHLEGENGALRETIAILQAQILALICANPSLQDRSFSRLYFEFALVIDARGQELPIPLQTITSREGLIAILKIRFNDIGHRKIDRQEWLLEDQKTGAAVDLSKPWKSIMKHGRVLNMNMIFRRGKTQNASTNCPSCGQLNEGNAGNKATCISCGLVYQRVTEHEDILVQPDNDVKGPDGKPPTTLKKRQQDQRRDFPRPRPATRSPGRDEDIAQYKQVRIVHTAFHLKEDGPGHTTPGRVRADLTIHDLHDHERLAVYLAGVFGLSEEECLQGMKDLNPQLPGANAQLEEVLQDTISGPQLSSDRLRRREAAMSLEEKIDLLMRSADGPPEAVRLLEYYHRRVGRSIPLLPPPTESWMSSSVGSDSTLSSASQDETRRASLNGSVAVEDETYSSEFETSSNLSESADRPYYPALSDISSMPADSLSNGED